MTETKQQAVQSGTVRVGVVGHTNVGKTSLMRTLTRDVSFGDVASSPGTTRVVEKAVLPVAGYELAFFDTPGLEDSAGLLEYLKAVLSETSQDWVEAIAGLSSVDRAARFAQEAKALRQVLQSDIVFYVIDVRDSVRAKHRDELEILMRCARPIVAVLNFVAQSQAGEASWRETLARTNIHAIAPFDTVVYDETGEIALYEKARTLADVHSAVFTQRIADIKAARKALMDAGAGIVAEMVEYIGAIELEFDTEDDTERARQSDALKHAVLERENAAAKALLNLFRFDDGGYLPPSFSLESGQWSEDPFDPAVLSDFGLNLGKAAATGAAIGLGVDLLVGGMTLGAAAATGAIVGTGIDSARRYGKGLAQSLTGRGTLQIELGSFAIILARQIALLKALKHRGHGAQGGIETLVAPEEIEPLLHYLKAALSQRLDSIEKAAFTREIEALT